ncbi:MAG: chemotaxis response regulator protein-glutamate methylesterase [Alphaproteobacteria bacterium]
MNQRTPIKPAPSARSLGGKGGYRVMVVDDSAVIRGFITRAINSDPEIEVAASASNGQLALNALDRNEIDVIVLDIEMPVMDGLTALPLLLRAKPGVKVIMASTLTRQNAAISMNALAAGASDYIPKPTSSRGLHASGDFQRELIAKIKALAGKKAMRPVSGPLTATAAGQRAPGSRPADIVLRKASMFTPEVLAIGSSTGGPQALLKVFATLKSQVAKPIFITQHMPPTFTGILAEHITRVSGANCHEAEDDEPASSGHIYVAPGDYHMIVERKDGDPVIRLNKAPPENFCRPAVDPMLRSLAKVYGSKVFAVILTGMGQDGANGGRAIVDAGGTMIAQDEQTSVVWGMPGAVAMAGLASAVLPIDDVGPKIIRTFNDIAR